MEPYTIYEKGHPKALSFNLISEQLISPQYVTGESFKTPAAIVIRNATKSYGKDNLVINGLNMTVQQGTIYGLLGCSGCGKSTTLNSIVGIDKFTSGDVWIFGKKPGSKEIGIPGRNIGFMPQDYSMYNEFTILEIFTFFGLLNGMKPYEIMQSIMFYTKFLHLPKSSSQIGNLSGGQKRRVSFAISLQHEPEVLTLDEPTVGVDPLLRERICDFLVKLTRTKNTTVIITTHYIEEARRSDTIGIMSNGKLIAEESPSALLERFKTNSLEHVVLQLTLKDKEQTTSKNEQTPPVQRNANNFLHQITSVPPQMAQIKSKASSADSLTRIRGLFNKNVRVTVRSIPILVSIILIPIFGLTSTFIGCGNNPRAYKFGMVNEELANSLNCNEIRDMWDGTCDATYFSCKYLNQLKMLQLISYNSSVDAENGVKLGDIHGFIHFPNEFSWTFYERIVSGVNYTDIEMLEKSKITVRMDQSSSVEKALVTQELYLGFKNFLQSLIEACKYDPRRLDVGLVYHKPILGASIESFRDYVMPSAYLSYLFFWPIVTTGVRFVTEKRDGTIERTLVAGVKFWEIFLAYSLNEFFIAVTRICLMYMLAIYLFKLPLYGNAGLEFLLGLMASYIGVFTGFLVGSFSTEEVQVALLALCIFLPNMLLSGMCWPLEAMHPILQRICYFLPFTLPGESMRSLMTRGWPLTHPNVYSGFIMSFAYILLFFLLSVVVSNFRYSK